MQNYTIPATLLERLTETGVRLGYWRAEQSPFRDLEQGDSLPAIEREVFERRLVSQDRWDRLRDILSTATRRIPSGPSEGGETLKRPAPPPVVLGRYEMLERIGGGGGGDVYRAVDRDLHRVLAIKRIPRAGHARFLREAHATARLQHPNIVPVFDLGEEGEFCYIVLQYVDGWDLVSWCKARRRSSPEVARIVRQAAEAIAYAHSRHVLHRDIKPENILVDARGQTFVTDFGLARETDSDSRMTVSGAIMGTPAYMAPEQAFGDHGRVDERSDVYSLGATLYFGLTGRLLFEAVSVEQVLAQVRYRDPIRPRQLDPAIPPDLETICLKATAKERDRRYASAEEFAEDLRRALDGEPIRAHPVGPMTRALLRLRRRPALAATILALLLSLLGGGGAGTYFALKARAARKSAERKERAAEHLRAAEEMLAMAEEKWNREGDFRRAVRLADEAVRWGVAALVLAPDSVHARLAVARAYALKASHGTDPDSLRRAEEHFRLAAGSTPRLPGVSRYAARLYVNQYLTHVRISLEPSPGEPRYRVQISSEASSAAERALRELCDLTSDVAWRGAMAATLRQEYAAAAEAFRTLEGEIQTDLQALLFYTLCVGREGRLFDAERVATTGIRANGFIPAFYYYRGLARAALGRVDDADSDFRSTLELVPEDREVYVARATMWVSRGDLEKALGNYRRAVELSPEDPTLRFSLGVVQFQTKKFGAAIDSLTRVLESAEGAKWPQAWMQRGDSRFQLDRYREALDDWRRAIELDPSLEPGLRELMESAEREGKRT